MRVKIVIFFFLSIILIQNEFTDGFKTKEDISFALEETTTKKSGFLGGIKNFFRGSSSTATSTQFPIIETDNKKTTTTPSVDSTKPLIMVPKAPLMPLGPRPETPIISSSESDGASPFNWKRKLEHNPTSGDGDSAAKPMLNIKDKEQVVMGVTDKNQIKNSFQSGFPDYRPPKLPTGLELSYGGKQGILHSSTPKSTAEPLVNLVPSTTTTAKPQFIKEQFPTLPTPKYTSMKPELSGQSSTNSAWNRPINLINEKDSVQISTTSTPKSSLVQGNRVSFIPHRTTTIRPGFESRTSSSATDDEIRTLTEQLYQKESNSYLPFIHVSLQGKTRSIDSTDEAPNSLLNVDETAFQTPSVSTMRLLFNNYESDITINEHVTPNERKEENDFLDVIMATNVMRHMMQFLQNKGLISPDPKVHRDLVKELWFTQYSRGQGKIGSSGFEHVFVNEVKNGTIIGLHNWVYFNEEEKNGHLDYKGYINEINLGNKAKVLKVRFTHKGLNKPVNSLFVGTSPEMEIALYTLCFVLRPDRSCPVSLGTKQFDIITYSWRYRGKNLIGSAYPEI